MGRKNNIFWGVALVAGAVALIVGRLGFLEGIGFWSILFTICLVAILLKGIARGKIGTILFSIAFLIIVNDKLLHLEAITPWPVLGAALLGTIGLKMLFPGLGRHHGGFLVGIGDGRSGNADYNKVEDLASYDNVFGNSAKYLSGVVSHVNVDNVFGSTEIYFMDARLSGGKASVNVDSVFGSVILYVPMSWTVELDTENIFGSSERKGKCSPDGENHLRIEGDIVFGSLEVIQV